MNRPTGITVLGILYTIGGIVMIILDMVVIGILSFGIIGTSYLPSNFFIFGGLMAIVLVIVAIIQFTIAGALFSGKSWARKLVIIFVIIDLIFETFSLFAGNVFGIILIIFDIIVLYYMWRPHVIAFFKGTNIQSPSQSYNVGGIQNPPPPPPPNYTPNTQNSGTSIPQPDPYFTNDETNIYPGDSDFETNTSPQKICQKCQVELTDKARFCHKCGSFVK